MTPMRDPKYLAAKDIGEMMGLSDHKTRSFILADINFPRPERHNTRLYWYRDEVTKYLKKHGLLVKNN